MTGGLVGALPTLTRMLLAVVLASCASPPPERATPEAAVPVALSTGEEQWVPSMVTGLPNGSELWDVASGESGVLVAVGTVTEDESLGLPLIVWRSPDGVSWRQVFRYQHDLGSNSAFVGVPRAAVAANGHGFAVVGSYCPERCIPLALFSADGAHWSEVEVPVRPPREPAQQPSGGGTASASSRIVLATPDYTVEGAEMLDVVATPSRLVAVGWAEVRKHKTAGAVWLSDDGGRNWRHAPEEAIPQPDPSVDELNKVVRAGDRLVAVGGNRCCYDQAVGEVRVSDTGDRWRPVPVPESASITGLAASGDAVHVVGAVDMTNERRPVQWRLSADDRWERLPATPLPGRFLAHPDGLLVAVPETTAAEQERLALFHSPDGQRFRIARTSGPREALQVEQALVVGNRLLVYVTAGEGDDQRRLLFQTHEPGGEPRNGRAVWATRVRPSPVLFGEGVRVPGGGGRLVDVTPPQKTAADLVVDAFFVDHDHGWVLLADSEKQVRRLLLTRDGGTHWAPGGYGPSPETARSLFFVDPENGWIVAYSQSGTSPRPSSLYRTTDGGRTWSGPSPLPACGPVHFDNLSHGWLADSPGGCAILAPLHETTDGGATWTKRKVAQQAPGEPMSDRYGQPRFDSSILPAGLMEGSRHRAAFFTSEDEGRTWTLSAAAEFPGAESNGFPQASVAERRVWWAADGDGSATAVTTDGGKRWRHDRPAGIRGRLVSLEGIDERRAWAVESNADVVRLVETRNAGATWRPLVQGGG